MNLQERIKQACNEIGDVTCESYSGRGMYGDKCLGIVGSSRDCYKVLAFVIGSQAQELFDDALQSSDDNINQLHDENDDLQSNINTLIADFRTDSMGYDIVMYWPEIPFVGEESTSDEDDD